MRRRNSRCSFAKRPRPWAGNDIAVTPTSTNRYLTISETATLARVSPKRLRNLMSSGVLREGHHYVRPIGIGPRFRLAAVQEWLEGEDATGQDQFVTNKPATGSKLNQNLLRRRAR